MPTFVHGSLVVATDFIEKFSHEAGAILMRSAAPSTTMMLAMVHHNPFCVQRPKPRLRLSHLRDAHHLQAPHGGRRTRRYRWSRGTDSARVNRRVRQAAPGEAELPSRGGELAQA